MIIIKIRRMMVSHRFAIKYITLISGVLIVFGLLYLGNKDITEKSKSSYKNPGNFLHHDHNLGLMIQGRKNSALLNYHPPFKGIKPGSFFGFSNNHIYMRRLFPEVTSYVNMAHPPQPQIVLPLSNRRYDEGLDAIASVHRYFPKRKIVVYDIGLTENQKNVLESLCDITILPFDFSHYPPYVKLILRFHWKPIVLQDALRRFGAVLWIEASTRLTTNDHSEAISEARKTGIKIFANRHTYSTVSVTNPKMLKYLPSDMTRLRISGQIQTAPMIIYNTKNIEENFMRWFVLCALERNCMAPAGASRRCYGLKKMKSPSAKYLHCHRYDQSAMNILLKNLFNFDKSKFLSTHRISKLKRGHDKNLIPKQCKPLRKDLMKYLVKQNNAAVKQMQAAGKLGADKKVAELRKAAIAHRVAIARKVAERQAAKKMVHENFTTSLSEKQNLDKLDQASRDNILAARRAALKLYYEKKKKLANIKHLEDLRQKRMEAREKAREEKNKAEKDLEARALQGIKGDKPGK